MSKQNLLLVFVIVFFFAVIAFTFFYGPSQRRFVASPTVLSVDTSAQIADAWKGAGVKGRIVICFSRYLNAVEAKESTDMKVIERSMEYSIVRRVYHIPPDAAWPEIQGELSKWFSMRRTSEGFIGIFDDGRVYIMPLSKFSNLTEKALVIVEPKVWSRDELMQIAGKLRSGRISSDLTVIIRGSEKDAELFRSVMTQQDVK